MKDIADLLKPAPQRQRRSNQADYDAWAAVMRERADRYNSVAYQSAYEDAYLRFKRRARVDSSGVQYNVMDTDLVADGRHLMENDGRHSYGDYLDYEIRNGGREVKPWRCAG